MEREDQCTIIFHLWTWPEVAFGIDFSKSDINKSVLRTSDVFTFSGDITLDVFSEGFADV